MSKCGRISCGARHNLRIRAYSRFFSLTMAYTQKEFTDAPERNLLLLPFPEW